jgi:hypothetical protein
LRDQRLALSPWPPRIGGDVIDTEVQERYEKAKEARLTLR